jgi:hypothetical protein
MKLLQDFKDESDHFPKFYRFSCQKGQIRIRQGRKVPDTTGSRSGSTTQFCGMKNFEEKCAKVVQISCFKGQIRTELAKKFRIRPDQDPDQQHGFAKRNSYGGKSTQNDIPSCRGD